MLSARVNLTHLCLLPGQGLAEGRCSLTVAWQLPGMGEILDSLSGALPFFFCCHGLLSSLGKPIFKRHLKIHRVTNSIETSIQVVQNPHNYNVFL